MDPEKKSRASSPWRYLLPVLIVVAVAALVAVIAISGNGGSEDTIQAVADPIDSEGFSIEAGAVVGASLTAGDLPFEPGMKHKYAANSPGSVKDVSFDLIGPWDFRDGPEQETITLEAIDVRDAPAAQYFDDAALAIHSSWSTSRDDDKYSYQSLETGALNAYGETIGGRLVRYSAPSQALILPAAVGDTWVDSYSRNDGGAIVDIRADNLIVGFSTLRVPAGDYDAYLLQTKVTSTSNGSSVVTWDYVWLVPGIGRAAEIVSRPGETDEVFDRAYAFYRLEEFISNANA